MSRTVKVGYHHAYCNIERFIHQNMPKNKEKKQMLLDSLHDMQYCMEQTGRCEKYDEVAKLKKELDESRPK